MSDPAIVVGEESARGARAAARRLAPEFGVRLPQVVARRVRVELAERTETGIDPGVRDRVIDIVVAETLPADPE